MSGRSDDSYLRVSGRLFAFILPRFVLIFLGVRYAVEWLTSETNADFLAWAESRWVFDISLIVLVTAIQALTGGYKTWLGPTYSEWRRGRSHD